MKVFARLVVGAASMVINSSAGAQKPMVATLLWATEARFTDIGSARLGGDGSVLVADAGSAEVHFITNQGRVVRKVGGVGSGPGEYRQPLYVFPHAGLTALIDPALRRLTYFGGDGTYARTTPLPSGTSGVAASPSADSMGNLWFRGMPSDPLTAKTVSLLHLTVGKETIDTVTAVSATSLAHIATPATDKARGGITFLVVPYAQHDGYVALPNSQAFIARAATLTFEWIDVTGRVIATRPMPRPAELDVTSQQLDQVRPAALREYVPKRRLGYDVDFMKASPQGDVWIKRVLPRGAATSEWIVVSQKQADRFVTLTRRTNVLAVAQGLLVVAERNDDDLQRVAVYRINK